MTQENYVLTRLHAPYTPQFLFSIGLPSTEKRGSLSITDRQSHPDPMQYRVIKVWRGHSAGGAKPASSIFSTQPKPREQKDNEHSYYSGKSSQKISSSQIWQHQKSPYDGVPKRDFPNEDKSFYSSLLARSWRTRLTPRGSYKETNQLPAAVSWSTSRGIQSSPFPSFNPPTSISNRVEVAHRNPEKSTPSIRDFSQRPQKKVHSYLFKDSQTSVSGLSKVATMTHKQRQDGVYQLYPGQTQSFNSYQPLLKHSSPVQGKNTEDSALRSVLGGRIKASKADNKPDQSTKSIFGFKEFKSPPRQAVTEPSSSKQWSTSRRYSFLKGKDYRFKIPSLSPKYSFGRREWPAATTPGTLTKTVSPSTTSFRAINDTSTDRNTDYGIYNLTRFDNEPLGGTKAAKSATLQEGFEFMSMQGPQNVSVVEELKPLLKSAGSTESISRHTPDQQTHQTHTEQQSIAESSSSHKSTEGLKAAPTSELLNQSKLVPMRASLFNTPTSTKVRGRRVKAKQGTTKTPSAPTNITGYTIRRLPKLRARVKAFTFADILGSASFSGVRATSQTPIADKENFPATTKQPYHSGNHTSMSSEDETEKFINAEENKFEKGADMKASDLFLDNEGSGGFNMSDVLSSRSQALGEDLLELNYLHTSTGNVSFESVWLSQTEKQ